MTTTVFRISTIRTLANSFAQLKKSKDSDDESDSDDYDDDEDENEENDVFVESATKKAVINLLLDDDDDDYLSSDDDKKKNNSSKRNGPSQWRELKRKEFLDSPTMRKMQQIQKATRELKHQEHNPVAAVKSPVRVLNLEVIELTSTSAPQQQPKIPAGAISSPSTQLSPRTSPPRPIVLNIQAEIINTFNNVAEKTIHAQVALSTNNTLQELIHLFSQQQQLSKTITVGLMYRGKPMDLQESSIQVS